MWLSSCYLLRIYFKKEGTKAGQKRFWEMKSTSRSAKEIAKTKGLAKATRERKTARRSWLRYLLRSFAYVWFAKQNKNKFTFATLFYAIFFSHQASSNRGFELRVKVRSRCLNLNYKCLCTRFVMRVRKHERRVVADLIKLIFTISMTNQSSSVRSNFWPSCRLLVNI